MDILDFCKNFNLPEPDLRFFRTVVENKFIPYKPEPDEITDYDEEEVYKDVKNFRDLLDINIKFLKGELPKTFYHVYKVDDETIPLLKDLIEINNYGFHSISGQPGTLEYDFYSDYIKNYVSTEQKSYIEGYIESQYVNSLKEHLDKSNVYYTIQYGDFFISNMTKEYYNVTREKEEDQEWEYYTNLPNKPVENLLLPDIPSIFNVLKDSALVNIACKDYGPQCSVEKVLLSYFKKLN